MRILTVALVAALLAGLGSLAPLAAPAARAATNPKVAIIVGATHSSTARYRDYANEIAAVAARYTTNVVKVYSPRATWSRVKSAVSGASIVVYLGHGNGWPSPYTYDPNYTTKNGFGLNYDNNGDGTLSDNEVKYYGEPYIRTLAPATNAVVLLFHLCYASGNSEPGHADPTLSTARKRVDNYAAAFIKAGARAVLANGHSHSPYYIDALFTTRQTMDEYFRNAPDFHGNATTYESTRNPGYTYQLDPERAGRYYRSIAGRMSLTTAQVTGAAYASTSSDPATFVVPGNATPKWDGAALYGLPETAQQSVDPLAVLDPVAALLASTQLRILSQEPSPAWDGSPVFRVRTLDGVEGWMAGSSLLPRDSAPPKVWGVDDGIGVFSPNGDDRQDTLALTVELSEASAWTLRVLDGDGDTLAREEGSGDVAAMTWAPGSGSVGDGTYRWEIEAVDRWGNGPLEADGTVRVDVTAPELSLADAGSETVVSFAPNGDGYRDTFSFAGTSTEAGSLLATVLNEADESVDSLSGRLAGGAATLAWDGRTDAGYVPDGRYSIRVRARDLAGNVSDAQTRTVDVYAALGFVEASRTIFFPQDGDALARSATLSMTLRSPATVTWRVIDAAGAVVRTFATDEPYEAGRWTKGWDGRDDAGAFVPRGSYRAEVRATDGTNEASQQVRVMADAFRITVSDRTPGDGQRLTITVVSAEGLERNPRVAFFQPGISTWSAATTRIATSTYRVTVTLKSSRSGTLKLRAYGTDTNGGTQRSYLLLPLH